MVLKCAYNNIIAAVVLNTALPLSFPAQIKVILLNNINLFCSLP